MTFLCLLQGAVLVTLHKGEDLPSADPNGYSDPYVKFKLHDKSHKSTIKRFTLNPAWNEKFEWFRVRLSASTPFCMSWAALLVTAHLLSAEANRSSSVLLSTLLLCFDSHQHSTLCVEDVHGLGYPYPAEQGHQQ